MPTLSPLLSDRTLQTAQGSCGPRMWRAVRAAGTPLVLALLMLSAGCGTTGAAAGTSAPHASDAAASAASADDSVKPGINKPFLDPALDVGEFVKAFEGESREIAKCRDGITAAIGLRHGMDVADIGAGTGLFMETLAAGVGTSGTLYAVDISEPFLEHLRQRADERHLSQVQVRAGGERSVNLPAASLDLAFVCDTYHHFEHPAETLASLRTAIRPGGRLVVVDFEREPGVSRDWVLNHMRIGKDDTRAEIEAAGFRFLEEVKVQGLHENYLLRFERP